MGYLDMNAEYLYVSCLVILQVTLPCESRLQTESCQVMQVRCSWVQVLVNIRVMLNILYRRVKSGG